MDWHRFAYLKKNNKICESEWNIGAIADPLPMPELGTQKINDWKILKLNKPKQIE